MCAIGIGFLTVFFSAGIASITNRSFGKQEKVLIEGEITQMSKTIRITGTSYSVTVVNNRDKREYDFSINKQAYTSFIQEPYFKKEMNKGCFGFLYMR